MTMRVGAGRPAPLPSAAWTAAVFSSPGRGAAVILPFCYTWPGPIDFPWGVCYDAYTRSDGLFHLPRAGNDPSSSPGCKGSDTSLFLAKGHKISIFSVKTLIFVTEMLNRTVYQLCKRTQLFTENAASLMAEKF